MFKRRFRLPSPALVISMVTLSLVLGGTAFAAAATNGDKKADVKLIKQLAPTLSVKHANTATNATHATSATSAGSPATLASGKTETGTYGFGATGAAIIVGEISFPFPLATAPTLVIVNSGQPTPAGCTGNASDPGAKPGNLCVFEGYTEGGVSLVTGFDPTSGDDGVATKLGVTIFADGGGSGTNDDSGTWAVTAP